MADQSEETGKTEENKIKIGSSIKLNRSLVRREIGDYYTFPKGSVGTVRSDWRTSGAWEEGMATRDWLVEFGFFTIYVDECDIELSDQEPQYFNPEYVGESKNGYSRYIMIPETIDETFQEFE